MTVNAATAKALEERDIFECFVQAAGLVVRPESITVRVSTSRDRM